MNKKLAIAFFVCFAATYACVASNWYLNASGIRYDVRDDDSDAPSFLPMVFDIQAQSGNMSYQYEGTNLVLSSSILKSYGLITGAFRHCPNVKSITVPKNVVSIIGKPFVLNRDLEEICFEGDAPTASSDIFDGAPRRLIVRVKHGTIGWDGGASASLPKTWCGRAIAYTDETYEWETETVRAETTVNIVSTNVVLHYVMNSVEPKFAFPASSDMGFVNIITEVKNNGIASIPISWAMSYPNYTTTFGTDFTASLMKPTGKKDAFGKDMLVWQDYVAGTDPTDVTDVLRASITMVDGKPIISYTPQLDAERTALRKYTYYGKARLTDAEWVEIEQDDVGSYNFFKVTVEMR